jgi:hypothetical protein
MRRHGIQLPEPEASGRIDTQGINQNSPRYRAALVACIHEAKAQQGTGG